VKTGCVYGYEAALILHVALSSIFKFRGNDPDTAATVGALRVPNPISLLVVSRDLERLYRGENSSRISRRRLQILLGYSDENSCDETNINFKLRVNVDILRDNAVKPNDVLVCSAEL